MAMKERMNKTLKASLLPICKTLPGRLLALRCQPLSHPQRGWRDTDLAPGAARVPRRSILLRWTLDSMGQSRYLPMRIQGHGESASRLRPTTPTKQAAQQQPHQESADVC